jgi:hypothetical protein
MLAIAPLMAEASEAPRNPWDPPLPQNIVVTRTAQELFEKGLLPDPKGQLFQERMPTGRVSTLQDRLRQVSLAIPFLPVGKIKIGAKRCTATWLGEQDGHTYLLTAAHCLTSRVATAMRVQASFRGWNDRVLADGRGLAFIPPAAVGIDRGVILAVDLAVLRLPTRAKATDDVGRPLEQPLLDDLRNAFPGPVHLVGYGLMGITHEGEEVGRRWGQTAIQFPGQRMPGVNGVAAFSVNDHDSLWARAAPGDSGSAWWQVPMGYWTIVAITSSGANGGHSFYSLGPRVLDHIDWLRGVYPGVRTLRDRLTVGIGKPFVSRGDEGKGISGGVYFTVPEKDGTRGGPSSGFEWDQTPKSAVLTVVQDERTGERIEIKLRVTRRKGNCGLSVPEMGGITHSSDGMASCTSTLQPQPQPLVVSFHEQDNASMGAGIWTGRVDVEVRSVSDGRLIDTVPVHVRLNRTVPGSVTASKPFLSQDLVPLLSARPGSLLSISLPRQQGVTESGGPWRAVRLPDARVIELTARDVLNQKDIKVRLRAWAGPTCLPEGLSIECLTTTPFKVGVEFRWEDNPTLAAGLYRGSFLIKAADPDSPPSHHVLLKIAVNLATLDGPRVRLDLPSPAGAVDLLGLTFQR